MEWFCAILESCSMFALFTELFFFIFKYTLRVHDLEKINFRKSVLVGVFFFVWSWIRGIDTAGRIKSKMKLRLQLKPVLETFDSSLHIRGQQLMVNTMPFELNSLFKYQFEPFTHIARNEAYKEISWDETKIWKSISDRFFLYSLTYRPCKFSYSAQGGLYFSENIHLVLTYFRLCRTESMRFLWMI